MELKFAKARGKLAAVQVEMRRGAEPWTKIRMATKSPWTDTTPLAAPGIPEVREYRVRGMLKDTEIGYPSQAISVTVA